jgi:type IV secretion system protein VirB6
MSARIFEPIAQRILHQTAEWAGVASTLVTWVTPLVLLGLTISIMWHGMNVMRGAGGNMHLVDVFVKSLRAFFVMSLALAGGAYSTNVIGFFTELRTGLANLFSSAPAGMSSYAVLDESVGKATEAMRSMMPWVADNTNILVGNFTGLIGLASMGFMVGCIVVYAMVSVVNLLVIDFALAIVWAIGPLFVACLAFEAFAKFFDGWLGAVMKYTFTGVVVTAVLGIGNGIFGEYCENIANNIDTLDFIVSGFSALGGTGVLVLIAFRVPEIAGNIVGGIGLSVLGPAAASAPLAAISTAMKAGGRAGANATSYGAGAAAASAPGQRVIQAASAMASAVKNTSLGQRAVAASQAAARFGKATANMQSGSIEAAYRTGRGGDGGTGIVTGASSPRDPSGRPLGRPNF